MGSIGRFLRRLFMVGTIIGAVAAVVALIRNPLRRERARTVAATAWRTGRDATARAAVTVRETRGATETGADTGPAEEETERAE